MITIYGIRNCDTCRKALKWLEGEGIAHRFHDFRADGLDGETLAAWISALGWAQLLNRRGATWRRLPPAEKDRINADAAAALMLANPTLIKRPVADLGTGYAVGFGAAQQQAMRSANGGQR